MSQNVNAGSLRHVVDIEQRTGTPVGVMGAPSPTWTAKYSGLRAAFFPESGAQVFAGQEMASILPAMWRVRYNTGIKPGMRINWKQESRVFKILSTADKEGRHVYLDLRVKEIMEGQS